ncbi:hypothetical protein [Flavobacterium sp. UBA7682]|uniref:hypothetical protein n=1 Tax=Flavobacterium sp. UBA7682 TaxID=1946560 RepID=UPI0025C3A934|nr:hypothetical protein [Flavobacterium sp. UBA7682]
MKITIPNLQLELANNLAEIGQINIKYINNKEEFLGYISKMNDETLEFTMMKMYTEKGKNPYCDIDFKNIDTISIKYSRSENNFKEFIVDHS